MSREEAVTLTSSESDNGKKACFRATVSGVTFYQASEVIKGVDTTMPTLRTATTEDTGRPDSITITIEVVHNSNPNPQDAETVTVVFGGDCAEFIPDMTFENQAPDSQVATYTTEVQAEGGKYATCTVAIEDGAGNRSSAITLTNVVVRSGDNDGGVRNIYEDMFVPIRSASESSSEDDTRDMKMFMSIADVFNDPPGGNTGSTGDASDTGGIAEVLSLIETVDTFTRDLSVGSVGSEVRALQEFLNQRGFIVSSDGPGSPGQESEYFGEKTRQALIRYQQVNGITPASGYFGPITRAYVQNDRETYPLTAEQRAIQMLDEGVPEREEGENTEAEEVRSSVEVAESEEDEDIRIYFGAPQQETPTFTRDLFIGETGEEVRALQKLLNSLGFIVSDTGPGSPGQESEYFGEKTRQALIRYQQANGITPANGYFGPITRAHIRGERQPQ